jgi:transmembrane sensor
VSEQQNIGGRDQTAGLEEATTMRLLRLAGERAPVPAETDQRVRRAVLDEIRAVARWRRRRRRLAGAGAVLATAALVILALQLRPSAPPETRPLIAAPAVATAERVEGTTVTRRIDGHVARRTIVAGRALSVGDEIETGGAGRLAIRWSSGASVRLDRVSRTRLVSATALELLEGALYIDSGPGSPSLDVRTPFGLVKDVGTQFEIRLESGGLRVRVRSGLAEVHHGGEIVPARPGSEVRVSPSGTTTRVVLSYGPEWEWTSALAPRFDVDGRTLSSYLDYLCREQGWTLAYADAGLARDVSGIVVHGSVDGLAPMDALSVVLSTSGLTFRLARGHLVVSRTIAP